MKYDTLQAFEKHLKSPPAGFFSNLYTILGKNAFEGKEAADRLIQALLPNANERDLCLTLFDANQAPIETILFELNSLSFLTEKKVVFIQQADKLKKEALEGLESYIKRPNPCHYLIIASSNLSKSTSFYKALEKAGELLELSEAKPWEKEKKLAEWVGLQAALARKTMSYPVCQAFVKQVGVDQQLLRQELEKLACYVGDKNDIVLQDIVLLCPSINSETIWQLGEAIFRRDRANALKISRALLMEGQAFLPFLRQIRSQFQIEYQVCALLAAGKQPAEITQDFPYMKGQILDRHIHLAQGYGLERFKSALLTIDRIEIQSKNSYLEEELLADLLIFHLTAN